MTFRKFLKFLAGLFAITTIIFVLTSKTCPILLEYVMGSARHIGKPIKATVYTNGQINKDIKIYHTDKYWDLTEKANDYIVSLREFDDDGMLKYFNINLKEKWIGRPSATTNFDYDVVFGHLFQSETGGQFILFHHDMGGFNFDPQLSFTEKTIKFLMPPTLLKFDSVRIELP